MTIFMLFQWLTGKIKAGSARFASAVSIRTWVQRRPLSNRQMLKGHGRIKRQCQKSCKMRPLVAVWKGYIFLKDTTSDTVFGQEKRRPADARIRWQKSVPVRR